ncbi:hypothetical protein [Streptomyces sp. S186]|uniref:hypothetical protein n=1 Tax=Streptomyces sp. S186 TaxID=3434395 RepID=UPI003F66EA7F
MKTMRRLAVVCAVGAGLSTGVASAATPTGPGSTAHGPGRGPSAHGVLLANRDDGRRLTVHTGDVIEVRLTGERGRGTTFTWSPPVSGDPALLRRTAARATPAGGTTGRFAAAARRGTTTVTAQRRCHATAGSYCPHVVVPWKVTVTVT